MHAYYNGVYLYLETVLKICMCHYCIKHLQYIMITGALT